MRPQAFPPELDGESYDALNRLLGFSNSASNFAFLPSPGQIQVEGFKSLYEDSEGRFLRGKTSLESCQTLHKTACSLALRVCPKINSDFAVGYWAGGQGASDEHIRMDL